MRRSCTIPLASCLLLLLLAVLVWRVWAGTPWGLDLKDGQPLIVDTTIAGGLTGGPKNKLDATGAPGVANDSSEGYAVGSRWLDTVTDNEYVATDVTIGGAVWKSLTAASTADTVNLRGSLASRPAAGTIGRTYTVTDSGDERLSRDAGTVWDNILTDWDYVTNVAVTTAQIVDDAVSLGTKTTGDYVSGVTTGAGLIKTGTEAATLGLKACAADEVLKRNAANTDWICAAFTGQGESKDVNVNHTGTLTETTVYTFTFPANSIADLTGFTVFAYFSNPTQGATSTTVSYKLGGTTIASMNRSSAADMTLFAIANRAGGNLITSRTAETATGGSSAGSAAATSIAPTFTGALALTITIALGATTDVWDLRNVWVQAIPFTAGGAGGGGGGADEKVKITTNDTTAGFLGAKIACGTGLTCSTGTPGGNETLNMSTTAAGARKTWLPVSAGAMSLLDTSTCLGPTEKTFLTGARRAWSIHGCTDSDLAAANMVVLPEKGDATSPKWDKGTIDIDLIVMSTDASPTDVLQFGVSAYCRTPGTDALAAYSFLNELTASKTFSTIRRSELVQVTGLTVNGGPCSDGDELEVVWRLKAAGSTITEAANDHILSARVGMVLQ